MMDEKDGIYFENNHDYKIMVMIERHKYTENIEFYNRSDCISWTVIMFQ